MKGAGRIGEVGELEESTIGEVGELEESTTSESSPEGFGMWCGSGCGWQDPARHFTTRGWVGRVCMVGERGTGVCEDGKDRGACALWSAEKIGKACGVVGSRRECAGLGARVWWVGSEWVGEGARDAGNSRTSWCRC